MTRFGIFCSSAVGHLNPMCAIALALQRRGHIVILFGVPDALDKVSGLNLTTVEIGSFGYPTKSVDFAYRTLGKLTWIKFHHQWQLLPITLACLSSRCAIQC
jgi:UDP:flavonoid glycosyltransferase YjiC (YdhE family)